MAKVKASSVSIKDSIVHYVIFLTETCGYVELPLPTSSDPARFVFIDLFSALCHLGIDANYIECVDVYNSHGLNVFIRYINSL